MRIGIDTSYHQVLRAQCSAPRIASLQRPLVLLNTDKGRLCQIRASPDAKQVERHQNFACKSLRDNHVLFDFFDFFDFRFLIPRQAIHQHRLIPLISGPQPSLTMVDLKHRSLIRYGSLTLLSLHRCRSLLDLRRRKAWHLHAACKQVVELDGTRAMDVLIGQIGWMDGWIAVALRG